MSKPFDYSKWDNIELSDDEEDVHPNIERESWFRMKHRSRVEREEHEDKDKKRITDEVSVSSVSISSTAAAMHSFLFITMAYNSLIFNDRPTHSPLQYFYYSCLQWNDIW